MRLFIRAYAGLTCIQTVRHRFILSRHLATTARPDETAGTPSASFPSRDTPRLPFHAPDHTPARGFLTRSSHRPRAAKKNQSRPEANSPRRTKKPAKTRSSLWFLTTWTLLQRPKKSTQPRPTTQTKRPSRFLKNPDQGSGKFFQILCSPVLPSKRVRSFSGTTMTGQGAMCDTL